MPNYQVTITDGTGSVAMKAGTYRVSASAAPGYDLSSLSPTTFTATASAGSQAFTLSASGTLNMIFNETGAAGGTPVTEGTVVMTDSTGNTQYGTAVTIDSSGTAVFNNVPYGDGTEPFTLCFKQLTTDDNHNIHVGVVTVSMESQTNTVYVENTPIATQDFSLSDAHYSGLSLTATLDFTENA